MLPKVILYNAVSLDGRFDWFQPDLEQFYKLAGVWKEDATLVGSNTACKPDEEIPPEGESAFAPRKRDPNDRRPLLVVPDSLGRVRNWHFLRAAGYWREVVALCAHITPKSYLRYLEQRHIDCIVAGKDRVDLKCALAELRRRYRVKLVRADCGGTLNGVLLRAGLVDEVAVLVHPALVGGTTPSSMFQAPDLTAVDGVVRLKLIQVKRPSNGALWLRYKVLHDKRR